MTDDWFYSYLKQKCPLAQRERLAAMLAYDHPEAALDGVSRWRVDNKIVITPRDVVATVGRVFGFTYEDITSQSREGKYTRPRQIVAGILRSPWFDLSLEEIARQLGRSDHTTARNYYIGNEMDGTFWDVVGEVAFRAGLEFEDVRNRISGRVLA